MIVDVVVDVSQEIPSDSSTFFCLPLLTAIIGAASPSVSILVQLSLTPLYLWRSSISHTFPVGGV